MLAVTAVSAHVDLPCRGFQQERCPQRPVGIESASRKVPRRQAVHREPVAERSRFVPVEFDDFLRVETPVFEMLPDAERADDLPDPGFEFGDRTVVEVIPVVMRDDEQIHVGHVAGTVDVGALERPVEEGERCGGPEYGVDEHTPPFGLEQVGGVPEPHQQVAVPIQCAQVGLEGRDGRVGAQPLLFSEQEFEDAAQAAFVARHHRACFQVAELPVAVVRRLQDAFEPAAPRQASEGREVEDYQAGDRGGEYYSCQDSHCASYFRAGHIVSHWLYGAKIPFPAELRLYGLRFGLP